MIFNNFAVQIIVSIVGIGILIAWHELGHYSMARLVGMRVLRFSIGFGPKVIGFVKNNIEYQISLFPIGGFVHIFGMTSLEEGATEDPKSFINKSKWAQLLVVVAGPLFNYILAFVIFISVFWLWSPSQTPSLLINHVSPDSPAEIAGMKEGDVVTYVNGLAIHTSQNFLSNIQDSQGKTLVLSIERPHDDSTEKENLDLKLLPKLDQNGLYKVGLGYVPLSFSFSGAVKESAYQLWSQSTGILTQLGETIFGKSSGQFGGIVEITRQLSHATGQGLKNLLWLLASLSVALGLFNILPIPALDGSKILMIAIESVIRRPIPEKAQLLINAAGIIIILGLMLLLTVTDVMRIYNAI